MLKTHNLSLLHKGRLLIDRVSLHLPPKQIHLLIGLNGAGKSTLLKLFSGLLQPTEGKILLEGSPLNVLERRVISQKATLIPQGSLPTFSYSVGEMVQMGSYPRGKSCTLQEIKEALTAAGVLHLIDRPIEELSAGERQRVYLARALVTGAPLLLLDEPTASLDPYHQLKIWELLKKLQAAGRTLVIATHDLAAARRYGNTVALLQEGRLFCHGEVAKVLTEEKLNATLGVYSTDV